MAEYLLQERLALLGEESILTESAGTIAGEGNRAAQDAIDTMAVYGINMSAHRARRLTGEMIDTADFVVVMEKYHYDSVVSLRPGAGVKTVMMGKFLAGQEEADIFDPYGGSSEAFIEVLEMLRQATFAMADDLTGDKAD